MTPLDSRELAILALTLLFVVVLVAGCVWVCRPGSEIRRVRDRYPR